MAVSTRAKELALAAAQAASDKLATDIVVLDVSEQLVITDAFVIASAPNERQVSAIVDAVDTTIYVPRGTTAERDQYLNYVLTR